MHDPSGDGEPASLPEAEPGALPEGGDAVCWLPRVCRECGALVEEPLPASCWRCGALVGTD